ncbi:MAG: hypothetical protein GY861_16595 [bacterium]|nr:hypothetical protein [bacterium]
MQIIEETDAQTKTCWKKFSLPSNQPKNCIGSQCMGWKWETSSTGRCNAKECKDNKPLPYNCP